MGPDWTQVLRFTQGAALRFVVNLSAALRTALEQADARAALALRALDGALLHLDALDAGGCVIRAEAPAGADAVLHMDVTGCADGYRAAVDLRHGGQIASREIEGLALMLGGAREAFVVRRMADATQFLLRLSYTGDGRAEVALFTAPWAQRLPPTLRALVPAQIGIGALTQVDLADASA